MTARRWTFLTNHGAVYVRLAEHPEDTIRHMAKHLGMAERTVAGILADLREAGYVRAVKQGRRNVDTINTELPMRHPSMAQYTLAEFFALLGSRWERGGKPEG